MKKILFSTVLALTTLFIYRENVFAAPEAMQVSPAIEEISLTPGIPTSYQLTITNTADRPLGIHADVTNFQVPDEGTQDNMVPSPLISWTDVFPTDTVIPSNKQKTITVTIRPPKDIKKGGYYAAIFLTPFISKAKQPNTPVILTRVGTLVLAQYGAIDYTNLKEKTAIKEFSFNRPIFEESPFDFHFTIINNYFTHFTSKPFLKITPLFGDIQNIQLSEKHILPGKSRIWNESVTPKTTALLYKASLVVSVGAGNYISSDTYIVVIPGFHYILLLIILVSLLLIATYHKRARKALKILFTGRD